jgi:hypothetical protein
MAIVRKLERIDLQRDSNHSEVECTYSIVQGSGGQRFLQIDTYGSADRQFRGKKSQSVRFSPEAIAQLREILMREL